MNDHAASVIVEKNKIKPLVPEINFLEEWSNNRKTLSVQPDINETIKKSRECPELFERLTSLNISLTNACNLSCKYCYEQHNKDFGRFSVETIFNAVEWFVNINNLKNKSIVFFGGEPLIHKKLIMDFINTHSEYLNNNHITVSMVTNGTLLDNDFTEFWFNHGNELILSFDTFNPEIDDRGLSQQKINDILSSLIADDMAPVYTTIRPTITHKTAPYIGEFLNRWAGYGFNKFILQPLIMANEDGFIEWEEYQWNRLKSDIFSFLERNPTVDINVTEGMGNKSYKNTCLNKMDIISIDPSGDWSGCYFFVNKKASVGNLISGNIFKDIVYPDRIKMFDQEYEKMLAKDECKSCDLQNLCYQCPAGNLDTGGEMFRPDSMCKKFVEFYLDLNKQKFKHKFVAILSMFNKIHGDIDQVMVGYFFDLCKNYFMRHHSVTEIEQFELITNFIQRKDLNIDQKLDLCCQSFFRILKNDFPNPTIYDLFEQYLKHQLSNIDLIQTKLQAMTNKNLFYITIFGTLYDNFIASRGYL